MKRKQRIEKIILNNFSEFLVEICDNSQLHAGHNNFNGIGETHIEILLTRGKNSHKINRLEILEISILEICFLEWDKIL